MFLQSLNPQMIEKTILVWPRTTVKCPRSSPHRYYLVVYALSSYAETMSEFLKPRPTGLMFSPLWWVSVVLLLADVVILFFFSKYQQIGNVLLMVSMLVLIYSIGRNERRG
jgi:hypothetical protein